MPLTSKLCLACLLLSLLIFTAGMAGPSSPVQTPATPTAAPTASPSPQGAPQSSRSVNKRKRHLRQPTINDYVPCIFDSDQDYDLRDRDDPRPAEDDPLSEEEAKQIAVELQPLFKQLSSRSPQNAQNFYLLFEETFTVQTLTNDLVGLRPAEVEPRVRELAKKAAATDPSITADIENTALTALDSIIHTAVKKVTGGAAHDRPDDVSCSFSLLDWKETKDVFGRRVANDYIAIQVNVRNLNDANEFLIHDIQLAVDTGVNMKQFGRFQVGRDKLVVRAVAERGKSEDRRNLIINTLQTIGAISGGASTALTQATSGETKHLGDVETAGKLSTAVEIFQGAFITGLVNIFPDHTLEQINHISDLAFSASSTLKTVVPRQGSVPLTTFLAEKPLEQLPFSRCGTLIQRVTLGEAVKDSFDGRYKRQPNNASKSDTPGSPHYSFCKLDDETDSVDPIDPLVYTKPLHYKKWTSAALRILQQRIFVVVAGVHIQEMKDTARIDNVKCPEVLDKSVDLSAHDKEGNISCTLLGNRLDKIASVKLGNGDKPVQFKPAQDGNSATLAFKAEDFAGVNGSLGLTLIDTSGKQADSSQSLPFKVRIPKIDQVIIPDQTAGQDGNLTVVLMGSNLDRIDSVTLTDSTKPDAEKHTGTIQGSENISAVTNSITVTFDAKPADVKRPITVNFTSKDDVKTNGAQAKPQAAIEQNTKLKDAAAEKTPAAKKAATKTTNKAATNKKDSGKAAETNVPAQGTKPK